MDTMTAPSTSFPINYVLIVIRNLETEHLEGSFKKPSRTVMTTWTHKTLLVASRKECIVWLHANDWAGATGWEAKSLDGWWLCGERRSCFTFVLKLLLFPPSSVMLVVRTCGRKTSDEMWVPKTGDWKNLSSELPKLIPCAKKRYI